MPVGVSFKDIAWVEFATLDGTGKIIADAVKGLSASGVYHADGDGEGATTANITGLEEKGTPQYANGKTKRMAHGAQTPSLALTMLDMDGSVMAKMKGYVSDGKGGYVLSSAKKPHVAVIVASYDMNGNLFYDCFANGEMIEVAHNHGTNTNSEVDYNGVFEYDALDPLGETVFVDDKGVQRPYKYFYSADDGFDEAAMRKEVFGGYVDLDVVSVTNVSLDKTTLSGKVGDSGSLVATVVPANATNKAISFTSSDSTVATIDSDGNYNLVKAGSVTFTVTTSDGNKTATCVATVSAA